MKHNFIYAANKSDKDREAAIRRIANAEVGKMIWFVYVIISAFIGNIAVLYLIVQSVLKTIE